MTLYSAYKAGTKKKEGGGDIRSYVVLSSQVTLAYDEALLSLRWLNICLPMGSSD